jgi:hypothetical protein
MDWLGDQRPVPGQAQPCTTATNGRCSDELVVTRPRAAQMVKVTASFGGATGVGFLTFI